MIRKFAVFAAVLASVVTPVLAEDMPSLPDAQKTPGVPLQKVPIFAPACLSKLMGEPISAGDTVTLQMICTSGYTKCVRKVTAATKRAVYASYGLEGNHTGYCDSDQGCEVDHLISLEIGGSNDQKNLWPEPYQGEVLNAHVKDQLENWYHNEVCAGRMSLKQAQTEISTDWVAAYKQHLGEPMAANK